MAASPTTSASPTPTAVATAAPAETPGPESSLPSVPPASADDASTWHGISMRLPEGWKLRGVNATNAEVLPPGRDKSGGPALNIKQLLEPYERTDWPAKRLNEKDGWVPGDPAHCMAPGSTDSDLADVAGSKLVSKSSTRRIGGPRLDYREWEVPCKNGKRFTVKVWLAAPEKVVFYTLAADPKHSTAYDEIVGSADLSRQRQPR
ncbi:hypothetical protein D5H75_32580 [Bailinhaonella thermotolerans]|uniref:Uncharacterized protein n=1 Tax=Bailinhaonella thermotolerans TaxID=1070861 RepID=A0A3A4A4F1_9ACTN|nr:hypothetical protein D5H75_32580 [Bailinhaonella thermotolerans]